MKRASLVLLAALLFTLLAVPAVGAAPSEWSILGYHVVQPGETVFCIARAYGVDPWAIASQNGLISPSYIYPGMVLAIPAVYATVVPGPVCAAQWGWPPPYPCGYCVAYHTIVPGETLTGISLWYGVSMWHIAECNGIYNLNYIRSGDVLCIPDP